MHLSVVYLTGIFICACDRITLTTQNDDLTFTDNLLSLDDNITLTVNPPLIINGLASDVDVYCIVRRNQVPAMASLLSLVIAHSNTTDQPVYTYVATVNALEGHAHNISHDVEVISGTIDNLGNSSLHIRFRYPASKLTGLFVCEVHGFDPIGKPLTKYTTLKVIPTNFNDFFNEIKTLQSNLKAELNKAYANISILKDSMQTCLDEKDAANEKLRQRLNPSLESNFYFPQFFHGDRYYMTKDISDFNYTEAQNVCRSIDGYLAELDTPEEMIFFREFLITMNVHKYIWSGAVRNQEGVWVNQHNTLFMPIFAWSAGEPHYNSFETCQCSYYGSSWKLAACPCSLNRNDAGYVCEVPGQIR